MFLERLNTQKMPVLACQYRRPSPVSEWMEEDKSNKSIRDKWCRLGETRPAVRYINQKETDIHNGLQLNSFLVSPSFLFDSSSSRNWWLCRWISNFQDYVSVKKKKREYNETVYYQFVDFKKAYDSVGTEVLYNILIEFGVPMKLVRLIKMCLNKTYCKVRIGKHLIFSYPQRSKTRGCFNATAFKLSFRTCHYEGPRKPGGTEIKWDT
jgi:hypothetical protein